MVYLFASYICYCLLFTLTYEFCSNTSQYEIETRLATKTPYRIFAIANEDEIIYKDCKPRRMWAIIRHGTRNPSKKTIRQASGKLMNLRRKILSSQTSKLCAHEFSLFRHWRFKVKEEEEKHLVYEGEDEMLHLSYRLRQRFPKIIPHNYSPSNFKFKHTQTQRTHQSAMYFVTGLFGIDGKDKVLFEEPLMEDPILRFYKLCDQWRNKVKHNPEALKEFNLFLRGEEIENVIKDVKERAGLPDLKSDDVDLMYTICAFETAWNKQRISPWCTFFNPHTLSVMEYAQDLKHYWIHGYGYNLTYKQACPAFGDMINHIDLSSTEPNATFYFTHSGTILKLLAHMGLYQDNHPLTHDGFNKPRKWKVSEINSFASNLVFVNFDCKEGPKLLVLHQERVVHLPGCPQTEDLCPLKTVKSLFSESISECKFDKICNDYKIEFELRQKEQLPSKII